MPNEIKVPRLREIVRDKEPVEIRLYRNWERGTLGYIELGGLDDNDISFFYFRSDDDNNVIELGDGEEIKVNNNTYLTNLSGLGG